MHIGSDVRSIAPCGPSIENDPERAKSWFRRAPTSTPWQLASHMWGVQSKRTRPHSLDHPGREATPRSAVNCEQGSYKGYPLNDDEWPPQLEGS